MHYNTSYLISNLMQDQPQQTHGYDCGVFASQVCTNIYDCCTLNMNVFCSLGSAECLRKSGILHRYDAIPLS